MANWTTENTKAFCKCWIEGMNNGSIRDGTISNKQGWKDLSKRYFLATQLCHDKEQLQGRLRQLKEQWRFCNLLRNSSGLGRDGDGNVVAPESWWKENTKGKAVLMKFKDGLPSYLNDMDRMFLGNTVDGSTAYHPGLNESFDLGDESSDEAPVEDDDQATPMSVGSKRASSSSTTGASPSKRSKSPAIRSMDTHMSTQNEINKERLIFQKEVHQDRKLQFQHILTAKSEKIKECTRIGQAMGISADTPTLWDGLHNLILSEPEMDFFLATNGDVERMRIIQRKANENPK